jgi:hypothetical protein
MKKNVKHAIIQKILKIQYMEKVFIMMKENAILHAIVFQESTIIIMVIIIALLVDVKHFINFSLRIKKFAIVHVRK